MSEAWETWLLTTRVALDEVAASTLGRLAELRARTGERRRALEHVRKWISIDPWDEQARRLLLQLLALDGKRAAALTQADDFARSLRSEIGVDPSPEMQLLVDEIRSGRFPLRVQPVPGLASRQLVMTPTEPCIGRDEELGWLRGRLDDALTGTGGLAFVSGAAGSGKSVLMQAFASAARDDKPRLVVASGACNAYAGSGDPYLPFRQVLGLLCGDIELAWTSGVLTASEASSLWAGVPNVVEAILDEGPYLLGTLVDAESLWNRFNIGFPDHPLAGRLHAATREAPLRAADPSRQKQPILDQCTRVLTRIAGQRPLLMTIDDLQWADVGTLELMLHLARELRGSGIFIVAAFRPGDLAAHDETQHPIELVVNETQARFSAECLLELSGTRDFIDAWLDQEPNLLTEKFREHLFEITHGHCLFTVEMVRSMRDRGDLQQDERGRWTAGSSIDWYGLSPRVEATVLTRLSQLPIEVRRDLEVASIQGDSFSAEVVATARGVPAVDVALRLTDLSSAPQPLVEGEGTARVGDIRLSVFRFRHGLFQHHLYEHLGTGERQALHEATGRAIEDINAGRLEQVAVDLALHYDEGGLVAKAIEYRSLAGRRAMALSANADATPHLERALELVESLEPSADRDRLALGILTALGTCLQARLGYAAAATDVVYERVRALASQAAPSLEAAAALGSMITVDALRGRYADALLAAEQLRTMGEQIDAAPIETVANAQAGLVLLLTGRLDEADQRLRLAVERYDAAWDEWLTYTLGQHIQVTALAWWSIVLWHLGRPDDARLRAQQSIDMAREAEHPFSLVFALGVGGCVLSSLLEQSEDQVRFAEELGALAEREDFAFYRAAAQVHRGGGRARLGNLDDGLAELERGLASWSELGTVAFVLWLRPSKVDTLVRDGQLEAAGELLDELEVQLGASEEQLAALYVPLARGRLLRAADDADGAERELRQAAVLALESGASGLQLQAVTALAGLLCDQGRPDEGRALLQPVLDRFTQGADTRDRLEAEDVRRRLTASVGQPPKGLSG